MKRMNKFSTVPILRFSLLVCGIDSVLACSGGDPADKIEPIGGDGDAATGSRGAVGGTGGAPGAGAAAGNGDAIDATCGGPISGGGEELSKYCISAAPPNCTISDFDDSYTASGAWGDAMSLTGETFTYQGADGTSLTTKKGVGALAIQGPVLDFAGFGMSFGPCVDATHFDGLQFTIGGQFGGEEGQLAVQLQTEENVPEDSASMRGACIPTSAETMWTDCSNNEFVVEAVSSGDAFTYYVPFSEFVGGNPVATLSQNQLRAVQFQFNCGAADTTCNIDMQLYDLRFYREHEAALSPEIARGGAGAM